MPPRCEKRSAHKQLGWKAQSVRVALGLVATCLIALGCGCKRSGDKAAAGGGAKKHQAPHAELGRNGKPTSSTTSLAGDLPNSLIVAYAQFPVSADGQVGTQPGAARLEIVSRRGGAWVVEAIEDPESNVFHKALWYTPATGKAGILTLGGSAAIVKLWRHVAGGGWRAETLWKESFGGRFDRMRDAEVADLYGNGSSAIAVGTHDQGVVAVLRPRGHRFDVERLVRRPNTFIHEIEIGDLDGDGTLEVYATPSEPNKLSGGVQRGSVVRYIPRRARSAAADESPVVADLGNRHAKEIFVGDVDGDGRDELYVAVEALTRGEDPDVTLVEPVEIRRYDATTPPTQGRVIARIPDRLCRFLTAGDVDGDGRRELVAAAFRSGLWMLRPGKQAADAWGVDRIDGDSAGFEHAALLSDLDGDGKAELYVAADEQGELRQYQWVDGRPQRRVIIKRREPRSRLTWNITAAPVQAAQPLTATPAQ